MSRHIRACPTGMIGLMVHSFPRIGAARGMAVEEVFTQNRRLRVRLVAATDSALRAVTPTLGGPLEGPVGWLVQ